MTQSTGFCVGYKDTVVGGFVQSDGDVCVTLCGKNAAITVGLSPSESRALAHWLLSAADEVEKADD